LVILGDCGGPDVLNELAACEQLIRLGIYAAQDITDEAIGSLGALIGLQELQLNNLGDVRGPTFMKLSRCKVLEVLSLDDAYKLTDEETGFIGTLERLRVLSIDAGSLAGTFARACSRLESLEELACGSIGRDFDSLVLDPLCECSKLSKLSAFLVCHNSDEFLVKLLSGGRLTELVLFTCPNTNWHFLSALGKLQVMELHGSFPAFTAFAVQQMAQPTNLIRLGVGTASVADSMIRYVPTWAPSLAEFQVYDGEDLSASDIEPLLALEHVTKIEISHLSSRNISLDEAESLKNRLLKRHPDTLKTVVLAHGD